MSRAYRIRVSESIRRNIRVDDGFQTRLELLAILPPDQMAELLAKELAELGFERDEGVMRRVDEDGVEIEIDLHTGTVTAKVSAEVEVDRTIEREARVANVEAGEKRLRERMQAELERDVTRQRAELTAEVADSLEAKLRDLRLELDRATNRATAQALKARARQLGEVKEISENEETGEITIKVEV